MYLFLFTDSEYPSQTQSRSAPLKGLLQPARGKYLSAFVLSCIFVFNSSLFLHKLHPLLCGWYSLPLGLKTVKILLLGLSHSLTRLHPSPPHEVATYLAHFALRFFQDFKEQFVLTTTLVSQRRVFRSNF